MKKLTALAFVMVFVFTLAACGGNADTPSGGGAATTSQSSQPGAPAPALTSKSGEATVTVNGEEYTGTYDGEYADELFSGYGIWEYEDWRYEGYWENGLPNGEGTLTGSTPIDYADYGVTLTLTTTYESMWIDGFASGTLTQIWEIDGTDPHGGDSNHQWVFENVQDGILPTGVFQCVLCDHESGRFSANGNIVGVPPWSWGSDSAQSTDTPPAQSPDGDTQDTPPTSGADVQDIPDNGTPPAVEPPLESHPGDKGYFYATTDDYIVWITPSDNRASYYADDTVQQEYVLACFDEQGYMKETSFKYVFASEAEAQAFAGDSSDFAQIGNVVYNLLPSAAGGSNKETVLNDTADCDRYISMP
jgi:hypothetical protein